MNFREIVSNDVPALFDVRVAAKENSFSREALYAAGITEESVRKMLQTTHQGWLCEDREKVVGFAMGDGQTGELWVIAVLPEFEGKGIGSRLLSLVEEWLWSTGHTELWLWTSIDPKLRAYSFYRKRGWEDSEIKGDIRYMKKKQPNPESSVSAQPDTGLLLNKPTRPFGPSCSS
jgi:GNAT superfamily N-acetyltransferase